MKITRNIFKIVALAGIMGFVGCEGYLEEDNKSELTDENYFNENNADELVVGTYAALRGAYNNYSEYIYGTDLATTNQPFFNINPMNEYVNMTSDNGSDPWYDNYSVISKANITINRYNNQIKWSESNLSVKNSGIAQAKSLRALAYYNLVQQYGGVVIYLNEIDGISYSYSRSTEEEVYTQIIKDLEEAIPVLEENPSEWGRFSQRAAQHLLADVYTTRGYTSFGSATDFDQAAVLAEAAIGGYDIRQMSYGEVFDFDNQRNDEVLFSIQYGTQGTSNFGNNKYGLFVGAPYDYTGIDRTNNPYGEQLVDFRAVPTDLFYNLLEDNDTRDEGSLHRVLYASVDAVYSANGMEDVIKVGDTVAYFPKERLSDAELADKLNRYWVYQPGDYYYDGAEDVEGVLYQYSANLNRVNFPIFSKFNEVPFDGNGYRDLFVFRVAETHLIAAEAYLNAGNISQAAFHMNRVRERATGVPNHYTTVTIDDILDERLIELSGEENRWAVLKRTGKLEERVSAHNPHYQDHGAFDSSIHLVRPIPTGEIELSDGSLVQNPGY